MTMTEFFLNVFVCFIIYIIINRIHYYFISETEKLEKTELERKMNFAHEVSCTKSVIKNNLFNYFKPEEIRLGIRGILVILDKKRKKNKVLFNDELYSDTTVANMIQIIKNIDDYHQSLKIKFNDNFDPKMEYISLPEISEHLKNYSRIAAICIDKIILFQNVANKIVKSDAVYNDYK